MDRRETVQTPPTLSLGGENMNDQTSALLRAYSEHPIAYFPVYAKITGSITAGVLLSQILYWWHKMDEREFYKTDQDFADELVMGFYEVRGAKKKLIEVGLITVEGKGPLKKTHYTVHEDRLVELIAGMGKNPRPVCGKTPDQSEEKSQTITETTPKTTTETTKMAATPQIVSDLDSQADEIIDCLNEKAGTRFRHSVQSRKSIRARIREGATVEDCKLVIDQKAGLWRHDPVMGEYLRPSTLFRPSHFEEYLASAIRWHEAGRLRTPEEKLARARALADIGREAWIDTEEKPKVALPAIGASERTILDAMEVL